MKYDVVMTKEKDISFVNPYHQWIQRESFASNLLYDKFLNWLSGEFDLYLQDEQNGLDVFFLNGRFSVKKVAVYKENIEIEINVISKDMSIGNSIANQIMSVHNHFENMYSYSVK
ncbi:hypothetical protein [Winogradskyella sp.]|uniref:hypothetical protein n=1 Tax=Winogradskyella sp. TaxID=1883156 RepID=UPI0025ED4936|nr:hypothetical protein [Winogradskyella sp.]